MSDVIRAIARFNAGRDPARLAIKYRAMRESPFAFLRATCHLFYRPLSDERWLSRAPAAWLCGDLHLENFGSYKGDNRLAYFDLNDFDEAVIGPCTLDLVRLQASILVASESSQGDRQAAIRLCNTFVAAYADAVALGKPFWIERDNAAGRVRQLLDGLRERARPRFLDTRTIRKAGQRQLRIDGRKALPASQDERERVGTLVRRIAAKEGRPEFFEVLDVARRIAGLGSLGVERYIVLVRGKGSPDGNYLLDLKQALPSTLPARLVAAQPSWRSEAHRVVASMHRMQAVSMAFLRPIQQGKSSYVLRGLQPAGDRIDFGAIHPAQDGAEGVIRTMGELVAWAQLRSSGHAGSATADALGAFVDSKHWRHDLLDAAKSCAAQTRKDWERYVQAYDAGAFGSG